jgi:hypothetical protein
VDLRLQPPPLLILLALPLQLLFALRTLLPGAGRFNRRWRAVHSARPLDSRLFARPEDRSAAIAKFA